MLKTFIKLPDGQVLSSGAATEDAVVSLCYTGCVNSAQELSLGSVCAAMLEAEFLGNVPISAGDRLQVWRTDEGGKVYPLGIFLAEKPSRCGYRMKLTAYDPVVLLDRDVTGYLAGGVFPCSLQQLAEAVCSHCGVILKTKDLPLGGLPVSGISGEGITGRQVLGWIGALCGCFCRANTDGEVEFSWYRENTRVQIGVTSVAGISYEGGTITGLSGSYDGTGMLTLYCKATEPAAGTVELEITHSKKTVGYYAGSLDYEDYVVAPIEKVQLQKTENDVGTVYPDGLDGSRNTYIVRGNPLLGAVPVAYLPQIAQHLYERLQGVRYTPCKVSVPAGEILPGDVVQITDGKGKTITAYVMQKTQQGQKDILECTGSPRRDSTTAVNNRSYTDLQGKVLQLRTDIEGMRLEHRDQTGKTARLELDLEGLRSQVSRQEQQNQRITRLEQTADAVQISVEQLQNQGVSKVKTEMGYTFDDGGLAIHKTDSEISNLLTEKGMYVLRNGGTDFEIPMLQADVNGVIATDVSVKNYLVIGTHARLEDYTGGRTACFYMEG